MIEWRSYGACCPRSALQPDAAACPDCGRLLLRCMAFSECSSLVTPFQPCPKCIAPSLCIEKGAVLTAKAGDRLSVPLVLRNASGRSLWVNEIVKTAPSSGFEPVPIPWESIEAQSERSFTIDVPSLNPGHQAIRMIATLASRHKGYEERYSFSGVIELDVQGEDKSQVTINAEGTGAMVYAPGAARGAEAALPEGLRQRQPIGLERAERHEINYGIRGYSARGLRAPRNVDFSFAGFPSADVPSRGPIRGVTGALFCGRNSRKFHPQENPLPNDLCLRVYDREAGTIDEDATRGISRYHFDLLILNDRLCIQARSSNGVGLGSGKRLAPGEISELNDGDSIIPLPGYDDDFSLGVGFRTSTGAIDEIRITRNPAITIAVK